MRSPSNPAATQLVATNGGGGADAGPQGDRHYSGEQVAAYVSRLKGRRLEEEASRKLRSQRRADTVNANTEAYRKRAVASRRRLMDEKLQMSAQIERHLFSMLEEQSKWRHVMYQNVVEQDRFVGEMAATQQQLDESYLRGLEREERDVFREMMKDDEERWETLNREEKEAHDKVVFDVCSEVMKDVTSVAEMAIDFDELYDLRSEPGPGQTSPPQQPLDGQTQTPSPTGSIIQRIPKPLLRGWIRRRFYGSESDREERTLSDHLDLSICAPVPPPEGFSAGNALFSGLIQKLLRIHYPPPVPFHPPKPMAKAVVVLLGPKFAGKTEVGKSIAKDLNLWYASDLDLTQAALDEIERAISDEDLLSPQEAVRSELLDLGVEVRQAIIDGKPLPDELQAKLILNRIKAADFTAYDGILLDGCPGNRAVFEHVEAALSGFDPQRRETLPTKALAPILEPETESGDSLFNVERPPTPPPAEAEKTKKGDASKGKKDKKKEEVEEPLPPIDLPLVEPLPKWTAEEEQLLEEAKITKDRFGTHTVVYLQCGAEEIFHRFAGIRNAVDRDAKYHLTYNPPPLEHMARVAVADRVETDAVNLHYSAVHNPQPLLDWLGRFCEVTTVNAQAAMADVSSAVRGIVESTLARSRRQRDVQNDADTLLSQRRDLEELFAERSATRESVRKHLAAVYQERGVDPMPAELLEAPVVRTEDSKILPVPSLLPALLLKNLDAFSDYYAHGLHHLHTQLAKLIEAVYAECRYCTEQFDAFWRQPDFKQPLVNAFCTEFNLMQPALRRDIQGKEELHLRTDGLVEGLVKVAERRRDDAGAVIEQLLSRAAFLDTWGDAVRMFGGALVQLELERFFLVKQISTLYFSGVRVEPGTLDETETVADVIPLPRGASDAATPGEGTKPVKGDKAKPPPKKAAAKAPPQPDARPGTAQDDSPDGKTEDHFPGVVDKATAIMKQAADRMTGPSTPVPANPKDRKKAVLEATSATDVPTVGALAAPIVQFELELARKRIETIGKFIHMIIDDGYRRCGTILRAKLQSKLRKRYVAEMSAVNGVVFCIRTAIEEERPIQHRLILEGSLAAVDKGYPLLAPRAKVPPPQLPKQGSDEPVSNLSNLVPVVTATFTEGNDCLLTSTLTLTRVRELLAIFKKIAPDFLVYRDDFRTIVKPSDYDCVKPSADIETLFDRFDLLGCGAIDWREFIVHLLFFCEPQLLTSEFDDSTQRAFGGPTQPRNPYCIETPSLYQLFDFRNDIGNELLHREDYDEIPLFFEAQLEEERLERYRDVLWELFSRPGTEGEGAAGGEAVLDPNIMVMFFCCDDQPLRGIQKAFAMAAAVADENCSLTFAQMYHVFHFNACDATTLHIEDPYDADSIRAVFQQQQGGVAESLTFQEACSTQSGRMLFNNTFMYRKRVFVA